ncbi:uncharacterized protein LOC117271049 isoform X3 [Xyrichtys novacula]|uniref:Uncharacterized protein LOC117271049 isoform X3 n=1 Tax=Xyrichtys novacula TaxID=13765 RepID=A0AAV1GL71_XYRNO|nr:uncharacterized protein LOC117271049 isoform X3 [Xyrichtys novacula]
MLPQSKGVSLVSELKITPEDRNFTAASELSEAAGMAITPGESSVSSTSAATDPYFAGVEQVLRATEELLNAGPVNWRTMEHYKLRVIITDHDIQKVSLDGKPEMIEELKIKIKEKCKLQYDFSLMYEDPDLCLR